jgi:hypothetical protein
MQQKDQHRKVSDQLFLNHASKPIFFVRFLLSVRCYFLANTCPKDRAQIQHLFSVRAPLEQNIRCRPTL